MLAWEEGALRPTTMMTLEVILNLRPLELVLKKEAATIVIRLIAMNLEDLWVNKARRDKIEYIIARDIAVIGSR